MVGIAAHPTDPNTIYVAAAGGGVWRTVNGGSSWSPLTDAQATVSMGAIAVAKSNPSVIYAGTGEANGYDSNFGRGILISSDGGATWTLSTGPSNAFDRLTTAKIAVYPGHSDVAYAAIANNGRVPLVGSANTGIWKTTDRGVTWTNTTASLDSHEDWLDVAVNPSNPQIVYATLDSNLTTRGIYNSTDGGSTWTLLSAGPTGSAIRRIAIAIAPSNPQVLYASATSQSTNGLAKFMRSDDGGTTFTDLTSATPNFLGNQGYYDMSLIVDPSSSSIVYAGGQGSGIFRSTNSGGSWANLISGSVTPHDDHHCSSFDANGRFLDGTDGGIYRLDNTSPPSWSDLNGNLNTIQLEGLGLHPTDFTKAALGSQDNGLALYAGNPVWKQGPLGGDGGGTRFSPTNGNRVYFQNASSTGISLWRSDDGGNTWNFKAGGTYDPEAFYAPFIVDGNNGDHLLYGTRHVWETTSAGDSWTAISPAFSDNILALAIAPSDPNTFYAATSTSLFVTTNHGTVWAQITPPISGAMAIVDIQVDQDNSQLAYVVPTAFYNFTGTGHHVLRTTDGGSTWTDISNNLPNEPAWSMQIDPTTSPKTLYLGVDDGVFFSIDNGNTWNRFGIGLPAAQVFQLQFNRNLSVLAAATHGRGAWEILTAKKRLGQITSQ
jgi:photosystem II stability/assembly factor-like uncharacterized protein